MNQPAPDQAEFKSIYAAALQEAKERRQKALKLRNGKPKKTYREIGLELGVSTERARQMVNQAQQELRKRTSAK